ncbi:MAG: DMT family transporter [Hahellaceae bacterium]|nr:DMT family transporter [Hahellaceae bacterium]
MRLDTFSNTTRHWALLGLALTSLFWAGNALVARGVGDLITPLSLSFLRWFLCGLILLPFTVRALRRHGRGLVRFRWQLLVLATLSVACYNSLLYLAGRSTTALNLTLVSSLLPLATAALAWPLLKQALSRSMGIGIGLAFAGAIYIVCQGEADRLMTLSIYPGDAVMLLAMFLWALYSVLLRRWSLPVSGLDLFSLLVPLGVLILLPVFIADSLVHGWVAFSWPLAGILGYVSVFASLAAYLLWNHGVHVTSPATAALFAYLIPVFTALLSIPVLGEYPQAYHGVGGGMILLGLVWSQRS